MRKLTSYLQIAFTIVIATFFSTIHAQSTYDKVYTILQNNCTGSCHNVNSLDGNLDLSGNSTDVYNALINAAPDNSTALSAGYKLVVPGEIRHSYLFRKVNAHLDETLGLDANMGDYMPVDTSQLLSNEDAEMIRQWILFGAPDTGTIRNENLIADYYNGYGMAAVTPPSTPVEEGKEGLQLRIGPFFLAPLEEVEYFKKAEVKLPGERDVYRQEAFMDIFSHHFATFDLNPTAADNYRAGFRPVESVVDQIIIHTSAVEIGAWNVSQDVELPANTAYRWDETTSILLDYHIRNASPDSILAANVYLNIYWETPQSTTDQMNLVFPNYGDLNPFILQIPPSGQPYTETMIVREPGEVWNIWRVQGHTHQIGIDFDMFLRNSDGTKGDQIYEGYFAQDYSFNQGFYEYDHAPVRKFEPFLQVDMTDGLIFEATYQNNTNDTIGFGLTTQDEMFAGYIHYVVDKVTGITEPNPAYEPITMYPNPAANGFSKIFFNNPENSAYSLQLYDLAGKTMYTEENITNNFVELTTIGLPSGVYIVELNGETTYRGKLTVE